MQFLTDNILLIYFLPLIAAFISFCGFFFKFTISSSTIKIYSLIINIIVLIYSAFLTYFFISDSNTLPILNFANWFNIGDLSVSLGLYLDKFASIFIFAIVLMCFVIQVISLQQLKENEKSNLYFGLINMLLFFMIGFISSSNLIQSVILSILTGICIYLIMNLDFEKINISRYAEKFIIIDSVGNFFLLSAIVILIYFINAYGLNYNGELLGYKNFADISADFYVYMSDINFHTICILMLAGIAAKSGLLPFHSKYLLIGENYSPIIFLSYFSLFVTGGIFVFRLLPMFDLQEKIIYCIFTYALISLIYAIICLFVLKRKNLLKSISYISVIFGTYYMAFPATMTVHSGTPHTETNLCLYFTFISILVIFISVLTMKSLYKSEICCYKSVITKSYVDIFDKAFSWFSDNILEIPRNITKIFDKYIFPLFINILGYSARVISWFISYFQNGKIQNYILYTVIFIILMLILYLMFLMGAAEV